MRGVAATTPTLCGDTNDGGRCVFVPLRLMGRLRESVKVGLASMRKYLSLSGQKPDLEKCINMELVT